MSLGDELEAREIDTLIVELRALETGDVWTVRGRHLQMAFMERGALHQMEIYIVPELLGGEFRCSRRRDFASSPWLISATALDRGMVRLAYSFT